ncbi:MAG: HNH endonuclease [Candidatus Nanopelagicales bacterium]|jgi:hypothetical protein|nr:HNH endonuclease [Candidatus Nanopelagicales bacterium]
MQDTTITAVETLLDPDTDPLEAVAATEAVIAWAHARQLQALHQVNRDHPDYLDPTGALIDPAPAEIATTLYWSTGAAAQRLDLASEVCTQLPELLVAMHAGHLDLPKAREITLGTSELDPDQRVPLAVTAVTYAESHTRAQLRAWLARRVAAIDPEAADRRRKKAVRTRRVWIDAERDGMASIGAYLPAEQAQACWNAIAALADTTTDDGIDAARADTFVALLTGLETGQPVPVQVLITPAGPELAGHGPISGGHAAKLRQHATTIDLTPTGESSGYRPAPTLARRIRVRDRHCRFPGCRRPATRCDLDHVIPYPTGRTHEANLAALCRYHHRLKTHTPWQVRMLSGAILEWTSPRGQTFRTSLEDP